MMQVNEKIRCYRYELGELMDKIGSNYYRVVERLLEASINLHDELQKKFKNQINENLDIIGKLEREKREMETTNRDLKNR
jgi:hypothetical protein